MYESNVIGLTAPLQSSKGREERVDLKFSVLVRDFGGILSSDEVLVAVRDCGSQISDSCEQFYLIVGRLRLRWEGLKKTGMTFHAAVRVLPSEVDAIAKHHGWKLEKARRAVAAESWNVLYGSRQRELALRAFVKQELGAR